MDARLFDLLPVVVCEIAPVRDESGAIIDLQWIAANRLMNESILLAVAALSACASLNSTPPTANPR